MFTKAIIIGASRGLGRSVALYLSSHFPQVSNLILSSRKIDRLEQTRDAALNGPGPELSTKFLGEVRIIQADASSTEGLKTLASFIKEEDFDLVVYASGGGPHGEYAMKDWKDHSWALNVNLLTPMNLAHLWLKRRQADQPGRFVIVGSRVAESAPDPLAASYAAGKHGLMGFVSSMQQELETNRNKIWLFSPGYMDSEMLPTTAKVRHDGSKLTSVDTAAQAMLRWLKKDGPWHRVLS